MTYYQANTKTANRYELSPTNIDSSKSWQRNHMYSSSTFLMGEKNVNNFSTNFSFLFTKKIKLIIKLNKGYCYENFLNTITKE